VIVAASIPGQLVVAGRNAAKIFETSEHALDQIVLPVDLSAMGNGEFAPGARGDDCFDTAVLQ
jgi:hypothetical protein